jgi:hypothetical protein
VREGLRPDEPGPPDSPFDCAQGRLGEAVPTWAVATAQEKTGPRGRTGVVITFVNLIVV